MRLVKKTSAREASKKEEARPAGVIIPDGAAALKNIEAEKEKNKKKIIKDLENEELKILILKKISNYYEREVSEFGHYSDKIENLIRNHRGYILKNKHRLCICLQYGCTSGPFIDLRE